MQERGPSGTTGWKRYEVALDVPADTVNINFGVVMPGRGTAWFDDLQLAIDGVPYDATGAFDFDFESGALVGFFAPATDYTVAIDGTAAARGKSSLKIQSRGSSGTEAASVAAVEVSRRCGEVVAHMESSCST